MSTPAPTSTTPTTNMPPLIDPDVGCVIPSPGSWPVDPQQALPLRDDRLWIDGCFDFFHHGHAGVMLQSRRLGRELVVGLHSDAEIAAHKGRPVMSLAERASAVDACRFATKCVPAAPYVTSLPWITHYGCRFVTHGDDVTSDSDGRDCYRFVKRAGRMKIVPRTPGISTTDLVGRMLAGTKEHFIASLRGRIEGEEVGLEGETGRRIKEYAAAEDGRGQFVEVWSFDGGFAHLVAGLPPRPGQRVVYVDGGFDLFSSGHIAFLQTVAALEEELGRERGWFTDEARRRRIAETGGSDYGPAYVIAGVHDDEVVNRHKGMNYPIMNIFERGLCVVQCAYIHAVVFGAPYAPTKPYLTSLPCGREGRPPDVVYHGPTSFMPSASASDPYADARTLGIFRETPEHAFQDVNSAQIVRRILDNRALYEERQRKKGSKVVGEEEHRRREELEQESRAA